MRKPRKLVVRRSAVVILFVLAVAASGGCLSACGSKTTNVQQILHSLKPSGQNPSVVPTGPPITSDEVAVYQFCQESLPSLSRAAEDDLSAAKLCASGDLSGGQGKLDDAYGLLAPINEQWVGTPRVGGNVSRLEHDFKAALDDVANFNLDVNQLTQAYDASLASDANSQWDAFQKAEAMTIRDEQTLALRINSAGQDASPTP